MGPPYPRHKGWSPNLSGKDGLVVSKGSSSGGWEDIKGEEREIMAQVSNKQQVFIKHVLCARYCVGIWGGPSLYSTLNTKAGSAPTSGADRIRLSGKYVK